MLALAMIYFELNSEPVVLAVNQSVYYVWTCNAGCEPVYYVSEPVVLAVSQFIMCVNL